MSTTGAGKVDLHGARVDAKNGVLYRVTGMVPFLASADDSADWTTSQDNRWGIWLQYRGGDVASHLLEARWSQMAGGGDTGAPEHPILGSAPGGGETRNLKFRRFGVLATNARSGFANRTSMQFGYVGGNDFASNYNFTAAQERDWRVVLRDSSGAIFTMMLPSESEDPSNPFRWTDSETAGLRTFLTTARDNARTVDVIVIDQGVTALDATTRSVLLEGSIWRPVPVVDGGTRAQIGGVVQGDTYDIQGRLRDLNERGPFAEIRRPATGDLTPPSAPTGLVANSFEGGGSLTFIPSPERDVAFYEILTSATNTGGFTVLDSVPSGQWSWTGPPFTIGVQRFIRVRAVDRRGNRSALSVYADFVARPYAAGAAPANLFGTAVPTAELGKDGDYYILRPGGNGYLKINGAWVLVQDLTVREGAALYLIDIADTASPVPGTTVTVDGTTLPAASAIPAGSVAIDTSDGRIWDWDGSDFTLRGTLSGGEYRFGSGVPSASLGANGDSYVDDTDTGNEYIKASGAWRLVQDLTVIAGAQVFVINIDDGADPVAGTTPLNRGGTIPAATTSRRAAWRSTPRTVAIGSGVPATAFVFRGRLRGQNVDVQTSFPTPCEPGDKIIDDEGRLYLCNLAGNAGTGRASRSRATPRRAPSSPATAFHRVGSLAPARRLRQPRRGRVHGRRHVDGQGARDRRGPEREWPDNPTGSFGGDTSKRYWITHEDELPDIVSAAPYSPGRQHRSCILPNGDIYRWVPATGNFVLRRESLRGWRRPDRAVPAREPAMGERPGAAERKWRGDMVVDAVPGAIDYWFRLTPQTIVHRRDSPRTRASPLPTSSRDSTYTFTRQRARAEQRHVGRRLGRDHDGNHGRRDAAAGAGPRLSRDRQPGQRQYHVHLRRTRPSTPLRSRIRSSRSRRGGVHLPGDQYPRSNDHDRDQRRECRRGLTRRRSLHYYAGGAGGSAAIHRHRCQPRRHAPPVAIIPAGPREPAEREHRDERAPNAGHDVGRACRAGRRQLHRVGRGDFSTSTVTASRSRLSHRVRVHAVSRRWSLASWPCTPRRGPPGGPRHQHDHAVLRQPDPGRRAAPAAQWCSPCDPRSLPGAVTATGSSFTGRPSVRIAGSVRDHRLTTAICRSASSPGLTRQAGPELGTRWSTIVPRPAGEAVDGRGGRFMTGLASSLPGLGHGDDPSRDGPDAAPARDVPKTRRRPASCLGVRRRARGRPSARLHRNPRRGHRDRVVHREYATRRTAAIGLPGHGVHDPPATPLRASRRTRT